MSRLVPLEAADLPPEDRDIVATGMNLHKALAHSPRTARMSRQVGLYIRRECTLDRRLCELAIIQVAAMARSAYEYTHHLKIAEELGVPASDLAAVAGGGGLDPVTSTVLRAVREMWTDLAIQPDTFSELQAVLSPEHIVDLVFAVSFYSGFVRLTGSLGLELEPLFLPYLERFPLPDCST